MPAQRLSLLVADPQLANPYRAGVAVPIESILTQSPTCIADPRSFGDATLRAFAKSHAAPTLVVLLGKAFDSTLAGGPPIDPACRFISIDPEGTLVERAARELGPRLAFGCVADTLPAADALLPNDTDKSLGHRAMAHRSAAPSCWTRVANWAGLKSKPGCSITAGNCFRP